MFKLFSLMLISISLWAHGMNEEGPHQGEIRMIGTFHTELVLLKKEIRIYLLDISFKNPTTINSSVELSLTNKTEKQIKLSCTKKKEYFSCPLNTKPVDIKSVDIKATRMDNSPKEIARYLFPLNFSPR